MHSAFRVSSLQKGASFPAPGERQLWDAAVPHWSVGPVESVGCHTNLPLVPSQPGREVPGRAGAKGRTGSQGQPRALHPPSCPGELAGTAGLPDPRHPSAALCASLHGAGSGLARHGGLTRASH